MRSRIMLVIICCCALLLTGCSLFVVRPSNNNSRIEIEHEIPSKPEREEPQYSVPTGSESSVDSQESTETSSEISESSSETSSEASSESSEASSESSEASSESSGSEAPALAVNPRVGAFHADEVLQNYPNYTEFVASTSEYATPILITVDGTVKDFRILALMVDNIDESGNISYFVEDLYVQDYMTPDEPIVVTMVFQGSFPNNGFAFTDANGDVYFYALSLSGMDGSVEITPIE